MLRRRLFHRLQPSEVTCHSIQDPTRLAAPFNRINHVNDVAGLVNSSFKLINEHGRIRAGSQLDPPGRAFSTRSGPTGASFTGSGEESGWIQKNRLNRVSAIDRGFFQQESNHKFRHAKSDHLESVSWCAAKSNSERKFIDARLAKHF